MLKLRGCVDKHARKIRCFDAFETEPAAQKSMSFQNRAIRNLDSAVDKELCYMLGRFAVYILTVHFDYENANNRRSVRVSKYGPCKTWNRRSVPQRVSGDSYEVQCLGNVKCRRFLRNKEVIHPGATNPETHTRILTSGVHPIFVL